VFDDVFQVSPKCKKPLGDLPFFSITLNVGDKSICIPHVDGNNLTGGLCLASPYGYFDHIRGGHLILHELRLVLALPSGSFILFPSGLITHENIPISAGEVRRAFTAYSPASIFRWRDNGFRLMNEGVKAELLDGELQWAIQKSRFPHYFSARRF
jgi:hypothetical protein